MKKYTAFAVLFVCALTPLVGCGKKYAKTEGVTGKVTLDGAPLANCSLTFIAVDKNSGALDSFGKTNENGEYKLQTLTGAPDAGTTPGKYGVKFEALENVETGQTEMSNGEEVAVMKPVSILPAKYNDPKTSGFEVEVVSGTNTFDFDLQSK